MIMFLVVMIPMLKTMMKMLTHDDGSCLDIQFDGNYALSFDGVDDYVELPDLGEDIDQYHYSIMDQSFRKT